VDGSYPIEKYEIILVDDHSEEGSLNEIIDLNISNLKIIHLHDYNIPPTVNAFKKYGQKLAIQTAHYDWIISTDGDCIVPVDWMRTMASYTKSYNIVTGSIRMIGPENWLTRLQQFDVMGTMVGTNYGINRRLWYSANAANMLFRKEVYNAYNEQIDSHTHASGDDIFLIQYAAQNEVPLAFAANELAIVETAAETTWGAFYSQRLRWATKSNAYKDVGMKVLIYGIGFYNISIIFLLMYGLFSWNYQLVIIAFSAFFVKCISEIVLFKRAASFFKMDLSFWHGAVLSGMHLLYILIIGIASFFISDYNWKGRKVR